MPAARKLIITRKTLYSIAILGLLLFAALAVTTVSANSTGEPDSSSIRDPYILHPRLQIAPTPHPDAHLTVVGEDTAGDWLVHATAGVISAVVPDGDTIWATSNGGLLRWDRKTGDLMQYAAPQIPLPSNALSSLLMHNGKLYVSGRGGVAIFDRQDDWTLLTNQVIGIETDSSTLLAMIDDVLWVGGKGGIAQLYPDGHWEIIRAEDNRFPFPNVEQIVQKEDGIYIEVAEGLGYNRQSAVLHLVDGRWKEADDTLLAYLKAPDGSLWKGVENTLFRSADSGTSWEAIFTIDGRCWSMKPRAFDEEGRLYASANDTILVLENGQVIERYRFTDLGPELDFINSIAWDESDRMWVATDGRGLTMYDGEQWYNWQSENSGLREDAIRSLAVSEGNVYGGVRDSGSGGGFSIYNIEQNQWLNFWPGESDLSGGGVGGIAVDAQGRVYLATAVSVLDIYDHGEWEHTSIPAVAEGYLSPEDGLFDAEGNYWLATEDSGILKYDGARWYTHAVTVPGGAHALALGPEGRLWATTSYGLAVRDLDGNWYHYASDQFPVGSGWMSDVAVDAQGRVWVVSGESLSVFNGREWQTFTPDLAGGAYWGDAIDFDSHNRPWIGLTSGGVAVFQGQVDIGPLVDLANPPPMEELPIPRVPVAPGVTGPQDFLISLACLAATGVGVIIVLAVGGVVLLLFVRSTPKKDR